MSYIVWFTAISVVCLMGGFLYTIKGRVAGIFICLIGLIAFYIGTTIGVSFPTPDQDNRDTAPYHRLYSAGYEQALKDMEIPGWTDDSLQTLQD